MRSVITRVDVPSVSPLSLSLGDKHMPCGMWLARLTSWLLGHFAWLHASFSRCFSGFSPFLRPCSDWHYVLTITALSDIPVRPLRSVRALSPKNKQKTCHTGKRNVRRTVLNSSIRYDVFVKLDFLDYILSAPYFHVNSLLCSLISLHFFFKQTTCLHSSPPSTCFIYRFSSPLPSPLPVLLPVVSTLSDTTLISFAKAPLQNKESVQLTRWTNSPPGSLCQLPVIIWLHANLWRNLLQ